MHHAGEIDRDEFRVLLQAFSGQGRAPSEEMLEKLFLEADADSSGTVDFEGRLLALP